MFTTVVFRLRHLPLARVWVGGLPGITLTVRAALIGLATWVLGLTRGCLA